MNVENLLHIIETLQEVQRRDVEQEHSHFKMAYWISSEYVQEVDCNTIACALGWESLTPYAHDRGLRMTFSEPIFVNEFGHWYGFSAGARYCDISKRTSMLLFEGGRYKEQSVKPEDVIARIQHLIAVGEEAFSEEFEYFPYVAE